MKPTASATGTDQGAASAVAWERSFLEYRDRLIAVAYRILGSVEDAEDIVQEALVARHTRPVEPVRDEFAFLCTIVVRRSLDLLKSAGRRRVDYPGEWLPEPFIQSTPSDPAELYEASETVQTAFLLALERLKPVERAAFVLRDVFDYDYSELATMIGVSVQNSRQIVSRARRTLRAKQVRPLRDRERQSQLLAAFQAACAKGSVAQLAELLCADVRVISDGGGVVPAAMRAINGRRNSVRFLLGLSRKLPVDTVAVRTVNGAPGLLLFVRGELYGVTSFAFAPDGIQGVYSVLNPHKLQLIRRRARWLGWLSALRGFLLAVPIARRKRQARLSAPPWRSATEKA